MFCFFGCETCGIPDPQPGIELSPPELESAVLTTGSSGKSLLPFFKRHVLNLQYHWF